MCRQCWDRSSKCRQQLPGDMSYLTAGSNGPRGVFMERQQLAGMRSKVRALEVAGRLHHTAYSAQRC